MSLLSHRYLNPGHPVARPKWNTNIFTKKYKSTTYLLLKEHKTTILPIGRYAITIFCRQSLFSIFGFCFRKGSKKNIFYNRINRKSLESKMTLNSTLQLYTVTDTKNVRHKTGTLVNSKKRALVIWLSMTCLIYLFLRKKK